MEFEELDHYLLAKPHTRLDFPFGDDVNVYKVMDKMFALVSWQDGVMNMNLKCDPDEAASLVSIFDSIRPGYHMNKRHWITIDFKGEVPKGELQRLIDNSFALVVSTMTKRDQATINLHL